MVESLRIYQLINSSRIGLKSKVLDIGTRNCALINQFLIHGYTDLIAIDKANIDLYSCFYNYKIAKKQVIEKNEHFILLDRENFKINKRNIREDTLLHYNVELEEYYHSIQRISNCDFLTFQFKGRFNIILSSFVFHFIPPASDERIIEQLTTLANEKCLLYMKVYNEVRLETASPEFQRDGLSLIKSGSTWYLFDDLRLNLYKSIFKVLLMNISGDITELLLDNSSPRH
ncbi:MAG: hypothetical protein M0Q51_06490 [Bacteroidales bacterium]|nr:hypothetical protein [Bacteroidales bacterium]